MEDEPILEDSRRFRSVWDRERRKAPRRLAIATALLAGAMLLYPPYVEDQGMRGRENLGYAPLWAPPNKGKATVNTTMLLTQLAALGIACGAFWLYLRDRG